MIFSADARDNKTQMTAKEQLSEIFTSVGELLRKKDRAYLNLMSEIGEYGIELISFNDIEFADAVYLENYFKHSIMPLLSPQIVGKKQPFPFLRNKEIYAVALLKSKNNEKLGIVPCSSEVFKRLIPIPSDKNKYMLVEELILHFMPQIFSKYTIKSKSLIRIIRNADIDVDDAFYDEDLDYRNTMEKMIRERRKLCPVKMEYSRLLDEKVIVTLCKELKLNKDQIYYSEAPLSMSFISQIRDKLHGKKDLFYVRRVPQNSRYVRSSLSMMEQIEAGDILLSYPFESMQPFIRLLNEAGENEKVVSIKMTLYRVAKNSQIVEALINAAENGKEVVVLVELRARFDEENNINWARKLEKAGCHVIYGLVGLKTHCKIALVVRKEADGIRRYVHLGTGNYNDSTAKLYTDTGMFTCRDVVGEDATAVFNMLSGYSEPANWNRLIVAPIWMKKRFLEMIHRETKNAKEGKPAKIIAKCNSLCDRKIILALYEASCAGVQVDLIVRGICCLVAGKPGVSENIRVRSIVGTFLEHARIFYFYNDGHEEIYMGSADWMPRNLDRRVEIVFPVEEEELKEKAKHILDVQLSDTLKAHRLLEDGTYQKVDRRGKEAIEAQKTFCEEAIAAANESKKKVPKKRTFDPRFSPQEE